VSSRSADSSRQDSLREDKTTPEAPAQVVLEVTDLATSFFTEEGELRAVDGVSFTLHRGRTLAVVGESGCGKSVTAYSVLRLVNKPGKVVRGSARFHSRGRVIDLLQLPDNAPELYEVRGGVAAMIFQEALAALSPVHTVGNQITEALHTHQKLSRIEADRLAAEMLTKVGIEQAELRLRQYPHELSGGMRQRVVIAMALITRPRMLIADEPTTALDVTIQAQVLRLLKSLQQELGTAILLITHDLGVVAQTADDVMVMYLGRVVEQAPVRTLLRDPRHPYTRGLLASLPSLAVKGQRLSSIEGSVPALSDIPPGCPFHPRCPERVHGVCDQGAAPALVQINSQHAAACVHAHKEPTAQAPIAGGKKAS
jgi:oligopeptide/dipeptide ABC transporter ATP-binding protein